MSTPAGTPTPTTSATEAWRKLHPGDRVRVMSISGNQYEATIVLAGRDEAGLYVRLANGQLARLLPERVNWKSLQKIGAADSLVSKGDEVIVVALGGAEKRGRIVDPSLDDRIVVQLPLGKIYSIALGETETKKFRLLFPTNNVRAGDEFLVKSHSGREYRGRAVRVENDRIITRLRPSRDKVTLRMDHLDMNTLHVLIPVLGASPTWIESHGDV